jgi:transposase
MIVKTILNRLQRFKSFVYGEVRFSEDGGSIEIEILPRKNSSPECSRCGKSGVRYGTLPERRYQFVPLWGLPTFFIYRPRRVKCSECGVNVERLPWAQGKEHQTRMFQQFLSHWARKLSWKQVSVEFRVSWNSVYRALKSLVSWGLEHRDLDSICAIGVDELMTWKGHRYVTMVYQIDVHCKRLLWVGKDRTVESFSRFFDVLGRELCLKIEYVCSDMWKGYLRVVRERLPHAMHILDRFHIVANLNKALDEVRAQEARRLKTRGDETLRRTRWCILKKPKNLTKRQRGRLRELLSYNLKTVRAYLLARDFAHFWTYSHPAWAARFLDAWCRTAMRSRIEPVKKIALQLRSHRELILNWFRAKKLFSSGLVEALNNNARLTMRKAYGFRRFEALEIALFHQLGALPEPPLINKFW